MSVTFKQRMEDIWWTTVDFWDDLDPLIRGFGLAIVGGILVMFGWIFATVKKFRTGIYMLAVGGPIILGFLFCLGWAGDWFFYTFLEPRI